MKQEGAGGNAIKSSVSINGKLAGIYGKQIIDNINNYFNICSCTLGSTGKKPEDKTSGDIDIALDLVYTEENVNRVKDFLHKQYGDVEIVDIKGLKILSWGFKYTENEVPKIVQVDFMFTPDVEYAAFMYHSPNYILNESEFKGLFRTNLMIICASKSPIDVNRYPTTYYEDGEIKDFWKYSWTYNEGLKIVHKTYEGKRKRLKNPKKIEEDSIFVTKDLDEIISIIFGIECTRDDLNSFESLVKFLHSDRYIDKSDEQLKVIFDDFFEDPRHLGDDTLNKKLHNEISKYGIYV